MAYRYRGYLYRSKRNGRKVQTEYLGLGEGAELIAQLDALEHDKREADRKAWQQEQERVEAADADLAELRRLVCMLMGATLVADGFHTHKGQWRRGRNGKKPANQ